MVYKIKQWRKERREIKSLQKEIRRIEKKHEPEIWSAKNEFEEGILFDNFYDEAGNYITELDYIKTRKLLNQARKFGIAVPAQKDDWFHERYSFYDLKRKVFTPLGEAQLRKQIRKQRREDVDYYLKIMTGLTGLIGTIIGLVAILK